MPGEKRRINLRGSGQVAAMSFSKWVSRIALRSIRATCCTMIPNSKMWVFSVP